MPRPPESVLRLFCTENHLLSYGMLYLYSEDIKLKPSILTIVATSSWSIQYVMCNTARVPRLHSQPRPSVLRPLGIFSGTVNLKWDRKVGVWALVYSWSPAVRWWLLDSIVQASHNSHPLAPSTAPSLPNTPLIVDTRAEWVLFSPMPVLSTLIPTQHRPF